MKNGGEDDGVPNKKLYLATHVHAAPWYPAGKWSAPPLSTLEESLYYTLTRVAWPLAICWIIFACIQGYGGLANSFLSSPLWQPFSRLSYSMYIWHMFVQEMNSRSVRTNTYFSSYSMVGYIFNNSLII